jgi:hypothetical protein
MVLFASLVLALAADPGPAATYSCWASLGAIDGVGEDRVYLEQDEQRRFLRHTLSIKTVEFDGFWSADSVHGGQPEPRPYATFWLRIPQDTMGPVRVTAMADGRAFWAGSESPNTTVRLDHGRVGALRVVALRGSPLGTFPSLWGLHRLQISAIDGHGHPILSRLIALPDWMTIGRRTRSAVREVDRIAHDADCLPATVD